ncbi:PAS-domain containing protein [Pararhodobacter oceanensis]|uniref:hybrid sensor histidine kinase/response regulator n=1 Tax=Pararhodobacter oceanensis TaxID=2172121 RepID=UPI003A92634E
MNIDTIDKLTRAGLNLIQQALSIFDHDLRLAVCNARYQEMFELPDALVTPGACFEDTIRFLVERGEYGPQDDPEEAIRIRIEMARAFKPHYMERQRPNGRWVSVEGAPLTQGGWVSVYTDISEIKLQERLLRSRSEELSDQVLTHAERLGKANRELAATNAALEEAKRELTEIEARTRLVTEMMPAHIAHVNRDLVYTYSNRRLASLLPGTSPNIVGLHALDALGPETYTRILPFMERGLAGEASVHEFTHEASGRRLRAAFTPDPGIPSPQGHMQGGGIYILSTDITEETQARAALMQTRKRELAAQLTSGLAHDFSNLLTIILGLQGKLQHLPGLEPEALELVGATLASARRGGTLLQRIGEISGARVLRPEPTNIAQLLEELRMVTTPSLPDCTLLTLTVEPGFQPMLLDRAAVYDSLLNLILNARDAMGSSGGTLHLIARRVRDTWLELAVEDDGPGFSEEALKRAWEPFFTTKGGEGSGLGLAMVYDQASLAGGSVRVTNRPEGGARVTLRLPLQPVAETADSKAHLVLLVEDNAEIRTYVRESLLALGHQVVEAESAADAEPLAALPEVGMVLSDIQLRGLETGVALLQRLRARQPELPLGLMTSLPASDALRRRAAQEFDILPKPFDAAALARFIARCTLASCSAAQ